MKRAIEVIKMNISRSSLLGAIMLLCSSTIFAQQEPAKPSALITFNQAVAKAAANQPLVLQAEAAVRASEDRIGQTQGEYLPRVTAAAGYDYVSPKQFIGVGSESVKIAPENAYDFHLDAGMLVYDFGKRELKLKLARNAEDSALIGVESIRQSIAYETARIYYDLLFLKDEVQELDEQIGRLNEHLEIAKKRESDGASIHLDVLSTQIRISKTANKRIDAATTFANQKIALRQLMGLALDVDYDVTGNFATVQEQRDEQTLIATALANRPEMQAALKAENAEELGRSLANLGNYPSVSVLAEAGYRNGLLTATNQNADAMTFNWGVGLRLSMPVFDGLRNDKAKDEAESQAEAAHQGSEELRRNITAQVLQALQDLSASQAQAINTRSQVEQAQEDTNMTKLQYDLGAGTNADYLDSLETLSSTKIDDFNAQLKEAQSGLALQEAIGDKMPLGGL